LSITEPLSHQELDYKIVNKRKLKSIRFIDSIFYSFIKPAPILTDNLLGVKKILLLRLAYIGDTLLCLPLLKPLRQKFPDARIDLLTSSQAGELLTGRSGFDRIYRFNPPWFYNSNWKGFSRLLSEIRNERYSLFVDLRGDIRNILFFLTFSKAEARVSYRTGGGGWLLDYRLPLHDIEHKALFHGVLLKCLNAADLDMNVRIEYNNKEILEARENIDKLNLPKGKMLIVIHPGARLPLKEWLKEGFRVIALRLLEDGHGVIGAGLDRDSLQITHPNFLDLTARTSLIQLGSILSLTDLFIGNDSGVMHLATFSGTRRVLGIFGPSKPKETAPFGSSGRFVCIDADCRYECDENTCLSHRYNHCMRDLSIDQVYSSVMDALKELQQS